MGTKLQFQSLGAWLFPHIKVGQRKMVVTKSIQVILNMLHLGVPQCQTHILLIIMKDLLVYISEIQKF